MGRRRRAQEKALEDALARAAQAGIQRGREQGFLSILTRIVRRLLVADVGDAARMVEADGPQRTLDTLVRLSRNVWRGRWVDGLSDALEAIMDTAPLPTDRGPVRLGFDVSNPETARFFENYRLRLAEQVTDTTREKLEAAIREGIEEGLSVPDVARRVSEVGEEFAGYRSELIARTELLNASRSMAHAQATSGGVPMRGKVWRATMDARTRDEHRRLDGEAVGLDEAWSNGEVYPSSPNCRCWAEYLVDIDAVRGEAAA
jgi:SPP1 gp7 family putative phage head morphogenesis protein